MSRLAACLLVCLVATGGHGQELAEWLAKAAQGDKSALFQVGSAYEEGKGTKQDFAKALEHYRRAARAGHSPAQARLAKLFQLGLGTERNDAFALFWYAQAAGQGQREAQYELGLLYSTGDGVERDPVQALKWIKLAASNGHADAKELEKSLAEAAARVEVTQAVNLATAFKPTPPRVIRPDEEPDPNARAIEEARRAQITAKMIADAEAGATGAQVAYGKALHWGNGVPQDEAASVKWFRKAAETGNADGQFCLGIAYFEGHGIKRDIVQAYRWTLIATSQGHEQAEINLGYVLDAISNEQLAQARELAAPEVAKWTEDAAKAWNAKAQFNLARLYLSGFGKPQDLVQGLKWLIIAAGEGSEAAAKMLAKAKDQVSPEVELEARKLVQIETHRHVRERALKRDAQAQVTLGRMCEEGVVEERNLATAWAWYSLASAQGHEPARKRQADLESKLSAAEKARAQEWLSDLKQQLQPASSPSSN